MSPEYLWIFGYGSLIWNPGFEYTECVRCYIDGYQRRFCQGSFTHRGTEANPGHVATIIPHPGKRTHGMAFKVVGDTQISKALAHLHKREILSGYEYLQVGLNVVDPTRWVNLTTESHEKNHFGSPNPKTTFNTISSTSSPLNDISNKFGNYPSQLHTWQYQNMSLPALTVIARPDNPYFLHECCKASLPELAHRIAKAQGWAGPNWEYVINVAHCMRVLFDNVIDKHLFTLERLITMHMSDET